MDDRATPAAPDDGIEPLVVVAPEEVKSMIKQVIVALVIITLCVLFFWQKEDTSQAKQSMPTWAMIDADQVNSIELRQAGQTPIMLKRSGKGWLIDTAPANLEAVDRLLQDLSSMQPVRVVTQKRSHDADLGLDAHGVAIVLSDAAGKRLLDVTIGKQGANLLTTYLRAKGSDQVLAMNKALNWQIHRSADAWRQPPPAQPATTLDGYATPSVVTGDAYAMPEPQSPEQAKGD